MFGKNSVLYVSWMQEWKRYDEIPDNLDFANLGSTCDANNFDYSYWDGCGFNFASGPQDMYYDNQLLEQYGKHLKKGALVFISISEFAFLVDKYETDYHNYKYYGYVEPQRILNYSDRKAWMIKHCPGLLDNRQMKQEIKSFIKRILKLQRNATKASLEARSRQAMANWLHEFGWDDEVKLTDEQRKTLSRSWDIFLKDIEFCDRNGLLPVIVVPPFNIHLKKIMPYNILDECLWDYIELIKKRGIKVVNFWDDKELEDERYYSTPICLNELGKDIFNRRLQKELWGE